VKALILNSGMGKRMGDLTNEHPKCMTEIAHCDTILRRQLSLLKLCNIKDIIITTGLFNEVLVDYCKNLDLSLEYTFINNSIFDRTNYIYSIYLAREFVNDDIVLLHGDLVFEKSVLKDLLKQKNSSMTVSSIIPLPQKDFKAVIKDGLVKKVGVEFFGDALTAQPLYKLNQNDWKIWLENIIRYCENGQVSCYAEDALNDVTSECKIYPMDFKDKLCSEIDTPDDLLLINKRLKSVDYS
jgi:choline kinase